MNRYRILLVAAIAVLTTIAFAVPASADPVQSIYDTFFGCEGKFQWPCPGPVIW